MNRRHVLVFSMLSMLFALMAAFAFGVAKGRQTEHSVFKTDTLVSIDTVVVTRMVHDTVFEVRKELVYLHHFDTVVRHDSAFVAIPVESKRYHIADTADIWISGYRASLDSMRLICRTITLLKPYEKETRETLQFCGFVSAGFLYGTETTGLQVGTEAEYNTRQWRFALTGGCFLTHSSVTPYFGMEAKRRIF